LNDYGIRTKSPLPASTIPSKGCRLFNSTTSSYLLWLVPLSLFTLAAWSRRWVAEDGFINLRIVRFIQEGYGPVYNLTERVEAGTSPLWLFVLTMGDWVLPLRLEWVAVSFGVLLTVIGLLAASRAGAMTVKSLGVDKPLPLGLYVYCSISVAWDFASGGLENGLGLFYLGVCAYLLTRASDKTQNIKNLWCTALFVGLGPLVRPDFTLFMITFLAVLIALSDKRRSARVKLVSLALVVPVSYQVFRMAFFGIIVPNTALTKSAAGARWSRGLTYLHNLTIPYLLLPVLGVIICLVIFKIVQPALKNSNLKKHLLVWSALPATGLVHAIYVIRLGGDFMHGRMLLPALFSLSVPVVVSRKASITTIGVLIWCAISFSILRSNNDFGANIWHTEVYDERLYYVNKSQNPHPVTLTDYENMSLGWVKHGEKLKKYSAFDRLLVTQELSEVEVSYEDIAPGVKPGVYAATDNIGLTGYAAGIDVHVLDTLGLAHPLVSRIEVSKSKEGRPGHDKESREWVWAQVVPKLSTPDMVKLLNCPSIIELQEAISAPLTLDRLISNFTGSLARTRLTLPSKPTPESVCP
jgi:arabinofuranosyltransferase